MLHLSRSSAELLWNLGVIASYSQERVYLTKQTAWKAGEKAEGTALCRLE